MPKNMVVAIPDKALLLGKLPRKGVLVAIPDKALLLGKLPRPIRNLIHYQAPFLTSQNWPSRP
jgi:hypothetical protein